MNSFALNAWVIHISLSVRLVHKQPLLCLDFRYTWQIMSRTGSET